MTFYAKFVYRDEINHPNKFYGIISILHFSIRRYIRALYIRALYIRALYIRALYIRALYI